MVRLRRARPEDADDILVAHRAAVRVTCATHYSPDDIEAWVGRLSVASYRDAMARRDVLVPEDGGRVLGFGMLDCELAEVRAVYIHPEAGRQGVGAAVLDALETIARLRGVTHAHLDSSLNAVGFYAAHGWRRAGDTRHAFPGGHDIACVTMTKRLPALRVVVREETAADVAAIGEVTREAFARDDEAALVVRLREANALALSLVATCDGFVVGHAALSPVAARGAAGLVCGLGPIAVGPPLQRCAIGARLVEEALARARSLGIVAVVVLGHPSYYPRFGFLPASRFGLRYTAPVPDDAFMAAELVPGALAGAAGAVRYHAAFDAVG
jgi:putative acetyltransferase